MNKKISIVIFVVIFSLVLLGLGFVMSDYDEFSYEIIIVLILLVLVIAQFILRRFPSNKDIVLEDEMSKDVLRIASSRSFYISLYVWLVLMYFSENIENIESLFGIGIASMGILFMLNVFYIKIRGVK